MIIYLIRHGETTGDIEGRYGGDYDDCLTGKGRAQSKEMAKKLKDKGIQIIYHIPKKRAKNTAKILNGFLNKGLEEVNELRERNNYGILTGLTEHESKKRYPKEADKLKIMGSHHDIKGSEDYGSFKNRILNVFEKITNKEDFKVVAVVSHGGPIKCILEEILKIKKTDALEDCTVIELEKTNNKTKIIKM